MVKSGGKTWFYLSADYAFGAQLQDAASKVVEANGGRNIGAVRVPLQTSDFSSFVLQAQSSGAQLLGLANAGTDFINSLKAVVKVMSGEEAFGPITGLCPLAPSRTEETRPQSTIGFRTQNGLVTRNCLSMICPCCRSFE
ncbi:MAG TPA: ABC transporter substrate-binding protein [Steroidobacteraceae bacterium]